MNSPEPNKKFESNREAALSQRKYKAYSEYKESGVEWLDRVPNHWSTVALKMIIDVRDGTHDTPSYVEPSENSYPLVTSKDVTGGTLNLSDCKQISLEDYESIITRSGVAKGDILMPMIGTVGFPILLEQDLKIAIKNLALFRTSENNDALSKKYLLYFLNCNECSVQFSLESRGGVQNFVSLGTLRNLGLPLVPREEQTQIANFLDHETAKIETLIDKQQQLIKLLKEKRQAVISHAVTKGLNPDAAMKDSGVEWLGEVPAHWGVVKLSYKMKLLSGDSITSNSIEPEGQYPVYGGNGLRGYTSQYNCDGEYVLIGRQGALCGNINLATGQFFASEHAVVVYPYQVFDISYLSEFLRFMNLGQYSVSAAQPGISVDRVNSLKIAVPPLSDQVTIGEKIKLIVRQYEELSLKASEQVKLLQERRTALISAAVTGKIDVRDWKNSRTAMEATT